MGLALLVSAVAAAGEDDLTDAAALGVLALVCATLSAALLALNALLVYAATPVGSADVGRKAAFDDLVNFALYALRVFLCWTRYIFYDLQVEGVDLALQQTDALFSATTDIALTPLEAVL